MKLINKLLSLLSVLFLSFTFTSCGETTSDSVSVDESDEFIDYTDQLKLDMTTSRVRQEVTVYNHVDGDTTHFNCSWAKDGVLKARYLAIDTPESTVKVEEWGKTAALFTRSKLENAQSIIIESDTNTWNLDSTGERYTVWVWYRTSETSDYRLLNLEIVQEGFSNVKNAESFEYGKIISKAYQQSMTFKLHLHGDEIDPNYYYGDAQPITLRELRTNLDTYKGTKVSVEGLITRISGSTAYVEDYDEETNEIYGIQVYMGFTSYKLIVVGNVLRFVGTVQLYETANTWQIAGLTYMAMKPDYIDNLKLISEGNEVIPTPITYETIETRKDNLLATYISFENLQVNRTYTTPDGDSKGAMTLHCTDANGNEVVVRTGLIKYEDGTLVTEDAFTGKNISVVGIFDQFHGEYQIRVLQYSNITFNN